MKMNLGTTQEKALRACIVRMRIAMDERADAFRAIEILSGLDPNQVRKRDGYIAVLRDQIASYDRSLRVELNLASAVLDGDMELASTALSVVAAVEDRVEAALIGLEKEIRGQSRDQNGA